MGDILMALSEAAKAARREYQQKWRGENKDKISEYHKQWREQNPDKMQRYNETYWEKKAERFG
jgi:hypothetical protein